MKAFFADRRKAAALIFLAALVLRLGFLWRQGPPPEILGDAIEYRSYAVHLLDTGRYAGTAGERATRMPGYPAFLAAVWALFGRSVLAALIAQCVLGAATCVLLFWLAAELMPLPWAAGAGLAAAGYGGLIVPCAALLSECVYGFFLVFSAWALYKKDWSPSRRALTFGALSGGLYLIRPEPLPYILATSALLPFLFPRFGRRETLKALAAAGLVMGLWVGRNFAIFHRLIPASTVGKSVGYLSLYLPAQRQGLAPEERATAPPDAGELEREKTFADAYRALARRLTWPQLVKSYVLNLSVILYPFLPEYDWTYVLLIPFWLIGFVLAVKDRKLWPIAGAVACSFGVLTFFGGPASRYRQGVAPLLILLAAVGARTCAEKLGTARWRRWGGAWLAANLLIWIGQSQFRTLVLAVLDTVGARGYTR
jgi:hypothetical protein